MRPSSKRIAFTRTRLGICWMPRSQMCSLSRGSIQNVFGLALHVADDEASDGLERMPGAAATGRLVHARPERDDVLSFEFFGASCRGLRCHRKLPR